MPIPKKPKAQAPKTARARVYQTLKEWIENNTLKPGEKIYDTELASYFEVSRTPVREAMQLLADQKLIEITPGKESRVAEIDFAQLKEVYILLGDLNVRAIEFAFPFITEKHIKELEAINQTILSGTAENFLTQDGLFHQYILNLSGNPFLNDFCNTLTTHASRFRNLYANVVPHQSLQETYAGHEKIIKALTAKDLAAACQAIRDNFTFILPKIDELTKLYQNDTKKVSDE